MKRLVASMEEVPEEAQNRFVQDPEAFRAWIQWGSGRVKNPYTRSVVTPLPDGGWVWRAEGVACRDLTSGSEVPCLTYTIRCPGISPGITVLEAPCFESVDETLMDLAQEVDPPATEGG